MCGSARLDLDPVLACGVKPLAYFDQNDYGLGPGPWARDKVAEVRSIKGTGLPVEQVVAERPDLLVTNSYLVEDSRDELQKVMPVLSPGTGTAAADGWSTALDQVAQALAAEDVAREHRRQVDARFDALAGEVASLKSLRVATIYGYNGSFGQEARGSGTYAVVLSSPTGARTRRTRPPPSCSPRPSSVGCRRCRRAAWSRSSRRRQSAPTC